MKIINYGKQYLDNKDYNEVKKVLKLDVITRGKFVNQFEKKISNLVNSKFSIVCNSGSSALFLSFLALNLKSGDNVIMPAVNFIASYNSAVFFGANIYLADVDKNTGQMTPNNVKECIKKFNIKKLKIILTQYHGGYPENIYEFYRLKKKYNCKIIEDACHSFGASYKHKNKIYKIGSCVHSDLCKEIKIIKKSCGSNNV